MFIVLDTRGGALRNLGPRVSMPSLLWIAAAEATSPREKWKKEKKGGNKIVEKVRMRKRVVKNKDVEKSDC